METRITASKPVAHGRSVEFVVAETFLIFVVLTCLDFPRGGRGDRRSRSGSENFRRECRSHFRSSGLRQRGPSHSRGWTLIAAALAVWSTAAFGAAPAQLQDQQTSSVPNQDAMNVDFGSQVVAPQAVPPVNGKSADLVVAPIPMHDPSQGWGLMGVAQYIFKEKHQAATTPPSVLGLVAFYTEQKSYGVAGGYLGHWRDDLWRPVLLAGYARLNYDFYGIGTEAGETGLSVPIEQKVYFALAQAMRRVVPHLYAGLRVTGYQTEIATEAVNSAPVVLPPLEREISAWNGGPVAQWDTRDNQFYPTSGDLANVSAMFYTGDRQYQIYRADWNHYHALGEHMVLAVRGSLRISDGDVPFYALSQFGQRSDLRGYTNGRYRDNDLVAAQTEFRHRFSERWGYVVFAGLGEVMPSFDEFNSDHLLGSVGAGLRFRLSKKNPVNFRFDWAYGKDGAATYLAVNEAF
jgi:hypothetical protein